MVQFLLIFRVFFCIKYITKQDTREAYACFFVSVHIIIDIANEWFTLVFTSRLSTTLVTVIYGYI